MYRCCAAIPPLSFLLFSLVSCFASLFHRPPSNLFASRLVPPRTFCRSALGKFCQKHVDIKNNRAEKKKKKEKNKKNKKKRKKHTSNDGERIDWSSIFKVQARSRFVEAKRSILSSDSRKPFFSSTIAF